MKADKDKVLRLLKTARGQMEGVIKMVEDDRYCVHISHQIMASEAILRKANSEILRAHIEGCVSEAFETGDQSLKDKNLEEILSVVNELSK